MTKQVFKNFIIYSSGAIVSRGITATITLSATNFLSTAEFGLLSLLNTFIAIVPIFLNLGLRQVFGLDFFHTDNTVRKKIIEDIISIYLLIATPILVLLISFIPKFNKLLFLNQLDPKIILLTLIICFLHFFTELLFQVFRYQSKSLHLALAQILMGITNAICAIILIMFFNFKILGLVLANLISILLIFTYGLWLYNKKIGYIKPKLINKKIIKYYLVTGFPFIPSIIFSWILSFADRWILAQYTSLEQVGIYSLADSFGQLFQMFILYPLSGSYIPYIFETFSKNKENILDIDKWNQKNMWLSMIIMFTIVIVGFILSKKILFWIIPIKFHEAINYILIILISQIIFMGSYFATCYLQFFKRVYLLVSFTVMSAILNSILNILLVPKFGIPGCLFSTFIAYVFYLAIILIVTKSVKKGAITNYRIFAET